MRLWFTEVILLSVLLVISVSNGLPEGKSLFDDLPLNGAYSPGVSLPASTPKPKLVIRPVKNSVNSIRNSESVESESVSKSDEAPNSLFSAMPNQGALSSKDSQLIFESKTKKRGIFATSQDLDRSPNGELRFQLEIERQTPSAEFNLADFHSNQLPSIVQSINRNEPLKPYTVLSPPVIPVITGVRVPSQAANNRHYGNYIPKPSTLYAVPNQSSTSGSAHNQPQPSNLYGTPTQSTKLVTHSVGPTVIIYGAPSPSPSPTPPPRNREIHRLYQPQRQRLRPPPSERTRQRQRHFGGYGSGRPENPLPIPIITGQGHASPPPVPPTASGYPTSSGNPSTIGNPSASGYPASSGTTPAVNPSTISITQRPPVTQPASNDATGDYDYDSLEPINQNQRNKWNKFGARTGPFRLSSTFSNILNRDPSTSYQIPPEEREPAHVQQEHPYPSDNYGPPTAPPAAYGPPTPPPTYGVPAQQFQNDPAPPAPPAPPVGSSTTSISYQTVPIQTVQTQLVTIPHVTVTSSQPIESESGASFPRPQSPSRPNTAYGPPSSGQPSPARGGVAPGALFTDDQVALLLSASRGAGGGNLFEDDPLTLLSGLNSNRGVLGLNSDAGLQLQGSRLIGNGNNLLLNQQIASLGGNRFGNNIFSNSQNPILGGGNRLGTNLFSNQVPFRNRNTNGISQNQLALLLAQQRLNGGLSGDSLPLLGGVRNGPILTGDAVDALSDILREQELRGAVSDLRGRLQHEGRSAARARRNYRSLFFKGALLLSALTLIPTIATPLAAAASGAHTSSFLLPLASGRRKRDVGVPELEKLSPFEYCNQTFGQSFGRKRKFGINEWIDCTSNATETFYEQKLSKKPRKLGNGSMFDSMAFSGAFVPENIRADLEKYVSPEEIVKNSECLQKRFCETLVEVMALPNAEAFLLLYSAFASDVENNPWIREAMNAARNKTCVAFYCYEDYKESSAKIM